MEGLSSKVAEKGFFMLFLLRLLEIGHPELCSLVDHIHSNFDTLAKLVGFNAAVDCIQQPNHGDTCSRGGRHLCILLFLFGYYIGSQEYNTDACMP